MNKNQIIGLLLLIIGVVLGFLWEKPIEYADVLDFLSGLLSALGISMVFKFLPIRKKKKTNS